MYSPDVLSRLLSVLQQQTESETISWSELSEGTYQVVAGAGSVTLYARDDDSAPPIILALNDSSGDLLTEVLSLGVDERVGDAIVKLYHTVHTRAHDINPTIERMIESLQEPAKGIDVDDIPF